MLNNFINIVYAYRLEIQSLQVDNGVLKIKKNISKIFGVHQNLSYNYLYVGNECFLFEHTGNTEYFTHAA